MSTHLDSTSWYTQHSIPRALASRQDYRANIGTSAAHGDRLAVPSPRPRISTSYVVLTIRMSTLCIFVEPVRPAFRLSRRADHGTGRGPRARFPLHPPAYLRSATCPKRSSLSYSPDCPLLHRPLDYSSYRPPRRHTITTANCQVGGEENRRHHGM
jgi:hypothetical protein